MKFFLRDVTYSMTDVDDQPRANLNEFATSPVSYPIHSGRILTGLNSQMNERMKIPYSKVANLYSEIILSDWYNRQVILLYIHSLYSTIESDLLYRVQLQTGFAFALCSVSFHHRFAFQTPRMSARGSRPRTGWTGSVAALEGGAMYRRIDSIGYRHRQVLLRISICDNNTIISDR